MEILLGGLTLSFVLFRESLIPLPFRERLEAICFGRDRRCMIALGSVFGLIFGMSNVGVQIVAYLKSLSLSHQVFIGVVGIVFIGFNVLRFTGGVATGLYPTIEFLLLSLGLTPAAYIGASLGIRY